MFPNYNPDFERPPALFYIATQNWQRVFFCGFNTIAGNVVLTLTDPKLTSGIFAHLIGHVRTRWVEKDSYTDNNGQMKQRDVVRHEMAEVLNLRVPLWMPQNGVADLFQPGQYTFPFQFSPSADMALPPNFDSMHGKITYTLKASIERPQRYPHRCFLPITLIPVINCNDPSYSQELFRQEEKTMCCLCCASGPILATARIPAGAWCPGEMVPFLVTVENHTKSVLDDVTCSLDYETYFYAQHHHTYESKRVGQQKLGRSIQPDGQIKEVIYLRIPSCCPSFSRRVGRIISHEYTLHVTVHLPAGSFNMHLRMPATIGTIPHMSPPLFREQQQQQQQQPATVYSWASAEQISKMAAASAPPSAPSVPTTYEDAYTDTADPDASTLGGQMQYVYFEMPQPNVGSVGAPVSNGTERTPLLGASSGPVAGEPATSSTTTTTTSTSGAPTSLFAAPCSAMDIPQDQ